ncbi:hypothetical protein C8C77_10918 [Halanaerobium saccharolyticum]|uniref:Uncharacterized protein n=1 Tax=Halanaerobium saccharolyticum TaxID=43595 RepID=A0A4R7Z548_9FIRM|nr:hypothetical protein [Halanaerobium saccharolyticum]RAK07843.1 hypothetical protein C7958_11213 [Halanaerobium saccharolyticum]TDW04457.1 hypothetical protein C8C77_10918 [Halanaerobium saccharolyticum]TDX59793.1 hypothetical protein C7956_11218 [Halanaerobium saccharolyticum]
MEGADANIDGTPGELTKRRYLNFSRGGAGLIWMEAIAVNESGRSNNKQYLDRLSFSDNDFHMLSDNELEDLKYDFLNAAKLAKKAGLENRPLVMIEKN